MSDSKSEYVTTREACEIARIKMRTLRRWIAKGAVTTKRSACGRKLLILRSEVEPQ